VEGDILAKVKTSLEDQPWHGNAVVSLGSQQFKPSANATEVVEVEAVKVVQATMA